MRSGDINEIIEQVKRLSSLFEVTTYANPNTFREALEQRVYEKIPFWEKPTPHHLIRAAIECERNYLTWKHKSPEDIIDAGIISFPNGDRVLYTNYAGINQRINPYDYFYSFGFGESNCQNVFLGKIKEQDTFNGINEYIISEEPAGNLPLCAIAYLVNNAIVGRLRAVEYGLWQDMLIVKEGLVEEKWRENLIKSGYSNLGMIDIENKSFEELDKEVSEEFKIALLKPNIKHEEGHRISAEVLPRRKFHFALETAQAFASPDLENFIRSVDDSIADTIRLGSANGRYPWILKQDGNFKDGLLDLGLATLSPEVFRFESDFILAYCDYRKTSDTNALMHANDYVFKKNKEIIEKIAQAPLDSWLLDMIKKETYNATEKKMKQAEKRIEELSKHK